MMLSFRRDALPNAIYQVFSKLTEDDQHEVLQSLLMAHERRCYRCHSGLDRSLECESPFSEAPYTEEDEEDTILNRALPCEDQGPLLPVMMFPVSELQLSDTDLLWSEDRPSDSSSSACETLDPPDEDQRIQVVTRDRQERQRLLARFKEKKQTRNYKRKPDPVISERARRRRRGSKGRFAASSKRQTRRTMSD